MLMNSIVTKFWAHTFQKRKRKEPKKGKEKEIRRRPDLKQEKRVSNRKQ